MLVTARKLRLLHAGVRTLVPRHRPDYAARFGPPVNLEDMLATIMGFSYLAFQGMINRAWNGEVTFLVPDSLAALRRLS